MDVVAKRMLLRYPVSVPLEEESNQEEEEGQREEGNMRTRITTTTTATTTSQYIEPHREQQTSLPRTVQPPKGSPALHSTPSPRDRSDDDVTQNFGDDDVIHSGSNTSDLNNNQIEGERSIGSRSDSSLPSNIASQRQNVLLAEVVIVYFMTAVLTKIVAAS